ncbi:hypothetical protein BJ741DRAFT_35006 [Chytriomyces cf. hyalinus JEL632]|nr:hypothetical protein BJ741DRAFT_35006 [Chytriomyces cf. hyalinus JEL632]
MVNCIKQVFLLLLAPLPRASPLFLVAFVVSIVAEHPPCVYCTLLIAMIASVASILQPSLACHTWTDLFRIGMHGKVERGQDMDWADWGVVDAVISA